MNKKNRALAAFATIALSVLIWVAAAMQQSRQTEEISRQWVGEQWDVARQCIVGTPIGRGEDVGDRLVATAIEALMAAAIAQREPDTVRLWPARCAPLLSTLRVDAPISAGDTTEAVGRLDVLMARTLEVDDAARTMRNARELSESIAAIDAIMPPGAEYELDAFPDPSVGVENARAIEASFACPSEPTTPRPFLAASTDGGRLCDVRGDERLVVGEDVRHIGPEGETRLDPRAVFARFTDEGVTWLGEGERQLHRGDEVIALPVSTAPVAFAPCGDRWWLRLGEEVVLVRDEAATRVRPRPPLEGVLVACNDDVAVAAWAEEERWVGVRCGATCEALPPLPAAHDLELGVHERDVFAIGRGRRGDLRLLWRLRDGEWTAPTPVIRGALVDDAHLEACDLRADLSAIPDGG